jgi:lipopolysaccharide cholinephosphotransferase
MTATQSLTLTEEQLRTLQIIELEILLELDRVCRKHNISYFLCSGTLLGAARHKGFIPWDDDVDVGFLRKEYERFCKVFDSEIDTKKFFLQTWRTDKYYRWNYGKIRRLGTEYVRAGQEHMKYVTGVSIDIFPYDYLPIDESTHELLSDNTRVIDNTAYDRYVEFELDKRVLKNRAVKKLRRQALVCGLLRKTAYSAVGKYRAPGRLLRFVYFIASLIPGTIIASLMDRTSQMYNDVSAYRRKFRQFGYANDIFVPSTGWRTDKFIKLREVEFEGY